MAFQVCTRTSRRRALARTAVFFTLPDSVTTCHSKSALLIIILVCSLKISWTPKLCVCVTLLFSWQPLCLLVRVHCNLGLYICVATHAFLLCTFTAVCSHVRRSCLISQANRDASLTRVHSCLPNLLSWPFVICATWLVPCEQTRVLRIRRLFVINTTNHIVFVMQAVVSKLDAVTTAAVLTHKAAQVELPNRAVAGLEPHA